MVTCRGRVTWPERSSMASRNARPLKRSRSFISAFARAGGLTRFRPAAPVDARRRASTLPDDGEDQSEGSSCKFHDCSSGHGLHVFEQFDWQMDAHRGQPVRRTSAGRRAGHFALAMGKMSWMAIMFCSIPVISAIAAIFRLPSGMCDILYQQVDRRGDSADGMRVPEC